MGFTVPLPILDTKHSAVYAQYEPIKLYEPVDMFCKIMKENTALYLPVKEDPILEDAPKQVKVKTPFDRELLFFNKKNLNGRIYTKDSIKNLGELIEKANQKRLLGELGHPDTLDVSLTKVSHVVEKIWKEDDKLMGTIRILETPQGKILQNLMDQGSEIVFSSRAVGNIDENGVCQNVRIFSFDAIPSSEDAFKNVRNIPSPPIPPPSRIIL